MTAYVSPDREDSGEMITLSAEATDHLRAACQQMELLLAVEQVDEGLPHLVSLLGHLRAIRLGPNRDESRLGTPTSID